jgi:hypothetical protein
MLRAISVTTIAAFPQNISSHPDRLHISTTQRLAEPIWLSSMTAM